jgi:hypothetical protein
MYFSPSIAEAKNYFNKRYLAQTFKFRKDNFYQCKQNITPTNAWSFEIRIFIVF